MSTQKLNVITTSISDLIKGCCKTYKQIVGFYMNGSLLSRDRAKNRRYAIAPKAITITILDHQCNSKLIRAVTLLKSSQSLLLLDDLECYISGLVFLASKSVI